MSNKKHMIGILAFVVVTLVNMILLLITGKGYEITGAILNVIFCVLGVAGIMCYIIEGEPEFATISGILAGLSVAFYIPYILAVKNKISHAVFDWQLGFCLFLITAALCVFFYCFYREYNGRFSGEQYKLYPFATVPALIASNILLFVGELDMRIPYAIVSIGSTVIMLGSIYLAWRDAQRQFTIIPCVMTIAVIIAVVVAFQQPVPTHEHVYVSEIVTVSTCVKEGELKHSCLDCESSYVEPIAVDEHKYKEDSRIEPTCTTEGSATYVCEVCNANYSETIPIAEHNYAETSRVESTCTVEGNITYACQGCGFATNEVLPLSDAHSYKNTSYVKGGFFKIGRENYTCEYCGDKYASVLVGYNVLKIVIWIIVLIIAIIIIKVIVDDEYRWWRIRRRPGFWISTLLSVIAIFCIVFYLIIKFVPEKGVTWYDKILVHDYNENEHIVEETSRVEATCTTEGKIVLGCKVCDDTYEEIIPLKAHSDVETARTNATCTAEGSVAYTCSVCGYSHTEEIEMLPHTYVEEKIEPTCSVHGAYKYTCSVCGDSYNEKIPVLKHNYVEQSRTEASFLKRGQVNYICALCGEASNDIVVGYPGWKIAILLALLVVDIIAIYNWRNWYPISKRRMLTTMGIIVGIILLLFVLFYIMQTFKLL